MECSILSSLKLSKQKHNDDLNRRSSKRRALTYARRDLLDTKPSELSVASSNSSNDVDLNFIRIDDSQNLSLCNDTSDSSLNETVPNDIVELSIHEIVYDNISEVSVDEESFTTLDEYFDFSLFTTEPDISLHNLTNVTKNEYCKVLLNLFRDANVCKTHCDRFIQVISSGLPTPNHMPKSTKALLNEMQVEKLFVKRSICTICYQNLNDHNNNIKCIVNETRLHVDIYEIDMKLAFSQILNRLYPDIIQYKQEIASQSLIEDNDIPFNTLIPHIDGVSLCKSSKLMLWLLSGAFVELPPHLRYRRSNMILLSIWIGYQEPIPKAWLSSCVDRLNRLKTEDILLSNGSKCQVLFYGIIGDCPALKGILEFIGHTGYHCCFYCYIHGIHVGGRGGKRQYYFENRMQLRTKRIYELESIRAVETSSNVYGHLGRSLLHDLLDVPLPNSIIVDYLQVSLLRHTRVIIQQVYAQLSPLERTKFDSGLRGQRFPHFFNRKLRAVCDLAFV
ncbi:unnamed protein product, partial [Rotaria magnacalcarata]